MCLEGYLKRAPEREKLVCGDQIRRKGMGGRGPKRGGHKENSRTDKRHHSPGHPRGGLVRKKKKKRRQKTTGGDIQKKKHA